MAPGSSVVPERVAVKCIGGINDPHTARFAQQEADVLKQLDGRAYTASSRTPSFCLLLRLGQGQHPSPVLTCSWGELVKPQLLCRELLLCCESVASPAGASAACCA